jgi:hypothetical protein
MRIEEERHVVWLTRLRLGLAAPRPDTGLRRTVRHFFLAIREPELGAHLGRIAALDSAVCVILGAMRHPRCALVADADLRQLLINIAQSEPTFDSSLERCFLTHKLALVPWDMVRRRVIDRFHTCVLWSSQRGKRVRPAKRALIDPRAATRPTPKPSFKVEEAAGRRPEGI